MGTSRSAPYTPFSVGVVPRRDEVVVAVRGEIDMHTADEVARRVRELWATGWAHLIVDLQEVDFIDSLGLRMLVGLRDDSQRSGLRLSVVPPSGMARRIFEITSTDELFDWRERRTR